MEEYRLKFEELSVYMDTFALSDQEKKEMLFQGLKEEYRCAMGFYEFFSFEQLVEAALNLDNQYAQARRFSFSSDAGRKRGNEGYRRGKWGKDKKAHSSSESSGGNYPSSGSSSGRTSGLLHLWRHGAFQLILPV